MAKQQADAAEKAARRAIKKEKKRKKLAKLASALERAASAPGLTAASEAAATKGKKRAKAAAAREQPSAADTVGQPDKQKKKKVKSEKSEKKEKKAKKAKKAKKEKHQDPGAAAAQPPVAEAAKDLATSGYGCGDHEPPDWQRTEPFGCICLKHRIIESFEQAPFANELKQQLAGAGFTTPTAIQAQAWPAAVGGADVIAVAKTGSG
eukprot:SAG31_NODE_15833_length_736_cov_1.075353_1_plen_206_part_10